MSPKCEPEGYWRNSILLYLYPFVTRERQQVKTDGLVALKGIKVV